MKFKFVFFDGSMVFDEYGNCLEERINGRTNIFEKDEAPSISGIWDDITKTTIEWSDIVTSIRKGEYELPERPYIDNGQISEEGFIKELIVLNETFYAPKNYYPYDKGEFCVLLFDDSGNQELDLVDIPKMKAVYVMGINKENAVKVLNTEAKRINESIDKSETNLKRATVSPYDSDFAIHCLDKKGYEVLEIHEKVGLLSSMGEII